VRREVRWDRMFPDELNAELEACPVVYLAYGLCEPHGPQNALGMDLLRPYGCVLQAAEQFGGIVAPPSWWHIHELGIYAAWAHNMVGQGRPWATALPPWMFFKNMCYHVRTMDALGFHAALLFSGHAGPHVADMKTMVEILQPHFAMRIDLFLDYDVIEEQYLPRFCHGGSIETEYLWAVAPDCVDVTRLPDPDAPGPHFAMGANARETDRREGERVVAGIVGNVIARAQKALADYEALQPARNPLTFDDIEEIWETEVRPRFADFASMQDVSVAGGQQPPPEDSRWRFNWKVPKRS
jgi:creatinine amidohydrolase